MSTTRVPARSQRCLRCPPASRYLVHLPRRGIVWNSGPDRQGTPEQQQQGEQQQRPPNVPQHAEGQAAAAAAPQQQQQQQKPDAAPAPQQQQPHTGAAWFDQLTIEILSIALPMLAMLAADPIAGLVDTAYMGRLGAMQLAGVGVALGVFNTTTKILNVPLLSVTTSSVAAAAGREDAARKEAAAASASAAAGSSSSSSSSSRDGSPSSATAAAVASSSSSSSSSSSNSSSSSSSSLDGSPSSETAAAGSLPPGSSLSSAISSSALIAAGVGVVQAAILLGGSSWVAGLWGVPASGPLWGAAAEFLNIRAVGAPVTVLLLVMQGVYRGLGDTRTPLYATVASNLVNVVLGYFLIFSFGLGIRGAALATVCSQALPLCWLTHKLSSKYGLTVDVSASTLRTTARLFAPTGYLVLRTAAITFTYAMATGLTARAGPAAAACHQVCFQLWLSSSLMADSLAVACQTLIARSLAVRDTTSARQVVSRCVGMAGVLGGALAVALAAARRSIPGLFTTDPAVLLLVHALLPWVVASQPINALAFVWDGVLFGAGGFRFASIQMALCALPAMLLMQLGTQHATATAAGGSAAGAAALVQLQWVWGGLILVMACRAGSIALPYKRGWMPFQVLQVLQGPQQQQQQHQFKALPAEQ